MNKHATNFIPTSSALAAISAVIATGTVTTEPWILDQKSSENYTTNEISPTHTYTSNWVDPLSAGQANTFALGMAEIYSYLLDKAEPLGEEFEKIWDSNIGNLYED